MGVPTRKKFDSIKACEIRELSAPLFDSGAFQDETMSHRLTVGEV